MATIHIAGRRCTTIASKARGQMFRFTCRPLLLCFSQSKTIQLHTFFCFQHLDIHFLDANYRVTSQSINTKFGRFRQGQAQYILETKAGEYRVNIGDKIHFIPDE